MIKSLVLKLVRRYAVGEIQDAIRAKGEAVRTWTPRVQLWLGKARLVVAFLERLAGRLADGELSTEEVERTEQELGILAGEVAR